MNKIIGGFAYTKLMFSIILSLSLVVIACSGTSGVSTKVPEPAVTITPVQFCQQLTTALCENAVRCEVTTMEECTIVFSSLMDPCEVWNVSNICPEGTVYNGELAHLCIEPMNNMTCEQEKVSKACETSSYCITPEL